MDVRFASPYFLVFLALAVYMLLRLIQGRLDASSSLLFSDLGVAAQMPVSRRLRLRIVTAALRIVAVSLLVLAIARPQLGRAEDVIPAEGIDITLALDVSYSMAEGDMGGQSRLQTAKDVIREFIAGRQNDRIGLVVFASEAVTVSPITLEYPVLLSILDTVDHGRLKEGTAIGGGLATSLNLLMESRAKSRIVILLTDGENNSGDISPEQAAQMAQLLEIRVYTVGVGPQSSFDRRTRGQVFTRSIDEDALRNISETTGAAYFRAADRDSLQQIYEIIGQLEKSRVGEQRYSRVDEIWFPLLLLAFALLSLELLLANTLFRRLP